MSLVTAYVAMGYDFIFKGDLFFPEITLLSKGYHLSIPRFQPVNMLFL